MLRPGLIGLSIMGIARVCSGRLLRLMERAIRLRYRERYVSDEMFERESWRGTGLVCIEGKRGGRIEGRAVGF